MKPSPLPVHPRPLPGEWLGSWLARVAEGNAITLEHLLELTRLRPRHLPEKRDLVRLAQLTATTAQDLVSLVPREDYLPGPGHSFLGEGRIQFCRECLKQDDVPYYRSRWLLATTASCPQHGGPLEQGCPHCKVPIKLLTTMHPPIEARPIQRQGQDLRRCPACGGDLAAGTTGLVMVPAITRPPLRHGRNLLSERHWERFTSSLRQMYTTFGLYEFLEPGTIALDQVTGQPSPPLRLDNRLRTDQFMAWACGEHRGLFIVVHGRLRLVAATLLGIIDAQPYRRDDPRLTYLAWLLTRLRDDQMQFALTQWPVLVNDVCHRLTSPPPAPAGPFLLSDRQWQAVSFAFPGEEPTVVRPALEGVLTTAARQERPFRPDPQVTAWEDRGQLGLALSLLFDQVLRRHLYRGAIQWERMDEDDQRVARLLLSDGLVELARTVAPTVHRRLLYLLIGRLRLYRE